MSLAPATQKPWRAVCASDDLIPNVGVRALVNGRQIALFRSSNDQFYAVDAIDPFSAAPVLSRGIVGDLDGRAVVASPIYKQHFDLETGTCVEDEEVSIDTFAVRRAGDYLEVVV